MTQKKTTSVQDDYKEKDKREGIKSCVLEAQKLQLVSLKTKKLKGLKTGACRPINICCDLWCDSLGVPGEHARLPDVVQPQVQHGHTLHTCNEVHQQFYKDKKSFYRNRA